MTPIKCIEPSRCFQGVGVYEDDRQGAVFVVSGKQAADEVAEHSYVRHCCISLCRRQCYNSQFNELDRYRCTKKIAN